MARRRYTSYIQRPDSDDSDADEHIFVRGKPPVNGGVRKRVGDIRFWLEDRENRRAKEERPGVNAPTSKSHHNKNTQNSPPVKTTTTLKPKRRNTTTPRRILSHIEITVPAARKLHDPPAQFVTQQSSPPTKETPLRPASPAMPPKKKKAVDAAYTARPSRKSAGPSTQASVLAPPAAPATTSPRRSRRTAAPVIYTAPVIDSDEDLSDQQSEEESEEETFSPQPDNESMPEDEDFEAEDRSDEEIQDETEDESEEETALSSKRVKSNNGRARKSAKSASKPSARGGKSSNSTSEPDAPVEVTSLPARSPALVNWRTKKTNMKNLADSTVRQISETSTPLSNIRDIFEDMTKNAFSTIPDRDSTLEHVLAHLGSRPLNVATMCSGTESPILAMQMFNDALKSLGKDELSYQHAFSAEIVAFKQAYIERNFSPPVIFRDIIEMTKTDNNQATTAYGALKDIPGEIDILIAGTACVDYSKLNNYTKKQQQNGESKDTFNAVLGYAKTFRPRILLLENVSGAPWNGMLKDYEDIGYLSAGVSVDTKNYYLPQTRQRGYMVCFDMERLDVEPEDISMVRASMKLEFQERMENFKRQASAPISSFLLPSDDSVNIRSRHRAARQSALDKPVKEQPWEKCEIRHIRYRREHQLGDERPLTSWQESGILVLSENADKAWHKGQVERVWDFLDMSLLRKAYHLPSHPTAYYDTRYKTRLWDVSQNIDRFTDTAPFGIGPCLTPSGIFYLTDREGPLTFVESLILQGLPLEKMSFTTETQRNIQDFAGNAMSTTVVGSAMLSALIAGFKVLPFGPERDRTAESTPFESSIAPSEDLQTIQLNELATIGSNDLQLLRADASVSASKCVCEGQTDLTKKPVQVCGECGHTSCIACGTKPSHEYQPSTSPPRKHPQEFVQTWRSKFPMVLQFSSSASPVDFLKKYMKSHGRSSPDIVERYLKAVRNAVKEPLTFKGLRRGTSWVITYESSFGRLDLVLTAKRCDWKLYAKAAKGLEASSELRRLRNFLEEPIAKCEVTDESFYGGEWHWRIYESPSIELSINGKEGATQIPSWAARLGLPEQIEEKVWSEIVIASDDPTYGNVVGDYKLLIDCGTACESLYKKVQPAGPSDMFLFLDPTRIGSPEDDCFVFASDPSKLEYDQTRDVFARVDSKWRSESLATNGVYQVKVTLNGTWISDDSYSLNALAIDSITQTNPNSLLNEDCHVTKTAASIRLVLPSSNTDKRYNGQHQIQADDKLFFDNFGWALEPLRQNLGLSDKHAILSDLSCVDCAPSPPEIRWRFAQDDGKGENKKTELRPYEDPETATKYEVAIKDRPKPLVMESIVDGEDFTFTVGINVLTLCERAVEKLVRLKGSNNNSVTWTLDTRWLDDTAVKLPPFTLSNNNNSDKYESKVFDRIDLFEKQQRSLSWMLRQEENIGQPFVIQEVEEALLPYLGWRLEARASSEVHVKGGILADHAGFGKTITSLALIHTEWQEATDAARIIENMRDLSVEDKAQTLPRKIAATLVVCPINLVHQWASEIKQLLSDEYDNDTVIQIPNVIALKKYTVKHFEDARIIIVSSAVFSNDTYMKRLARFAAMPGCNGGARATEAWTGKAASRVPEHLEILKSEAMSASRFNTHLTQVLEETLNDPEYLDYTKQSQRFRGKAYLNNKQKVEEDKQNAEQKARKESAKNLTERELNKYVLFEMFHFNRLIVDEFSYLEGKELVAYCNIKADKRWALSATPQLNDTYDISKMAQLLGINLPISASAHGLLSATNTAALRKDMTNVEQFETFRELPSSIVQERVHALSQKFLDTYVRRNVLRFDEFQYTDMLVPIQLNADHRLAYADLSRKLNGQNMRITNGNLKSHKFASMPKVEHAEEVLVRAAAIYRASENAEGEVISGLENLVNQRSNDCEEARRLLKARFKKVLEYEKETNQSLFDLWVKDVVRTNFFKDQSVTHEILLIKSELENGDFERLVDLPEEKIVVEEDDDPSDKDEQDVVPAPACVSNVTGKRKRSSSEKEDEQEAEVVVKTTQAKLKKAADAEAKRLKLVLEKLQGAATRDAKLYAIAKRTHRYVSNAAQREDDSSSLACEGRDCNGATTDVDDLHVSAACGHVLCDDCYEGSKKPPCLCPVPGCKVDLKSYDLLRLEKLGESKESEYGMRADRLLEILTAIQDKREQAILFVQYQEIITDLAKVLEKSGISYHKPATNDTDSVKIIKAFQSVTDGSKKTLLILRSSDVSAAGANLTNANHVIFFSPLLESTQYKYEAQMAQGIGRVRRHKQKREIYVYRMVALDTVDVDILEHRERNTKVLYGPETPRSDGMQVDGSDFDGAFERKFNKSGQIEWQRDNNGITNLRTPDKMQLIRDQDDRIKLVPRTMLLVHGEQDATIFETEKRIMGYEKFNSLVKFSRFYDDAER